MAILVGKDTKVVVQGITGSAGRFHTTKCIEYGTRVVAGVTPHRGGEVFRANGPSGEERQVPIFDTAAEAVRQTGADTSCIFVPALGAADAILEAVGAGCQLVVCITEGVPVADMLVCGVCSRRPRRGSSGRTVRHHHARSVQDRHHARAHPRTGTLWRRLALGYAHL